MQLTIGSGGTHWKVSRVWCWAWMRSTEHKMGNGLRETWWRIGPLYVVRERL